MFFYSWKKIFKTENIEDWRGIKGILIQYYQLTNKSNKSLQKEKRWLTQDHTICILLET